MADFDVSTIARRLKSDPDRERGDHDLNPGFRPDGPLRPAAVLLGLVEHPHGLNVLFTRRTDHLENHPGQISFPGGHVEDTDADAIAAALRETHEEVGVPAGRIDVLGRLDTYITRTGFSITPVIARIQGPVDASPDPHEVAEVFEVPLAFLMDPANHRRHARIYQGAERHFYAVSYGDYYIWGATAGMLMDLYRTLAPHARSEPNEEP